MICLPALGRTRDEVPASSLAFLILLGLFTSAARAADLPPPMAVRCEVSFGREIPIYAWQQRSDWINVASGEGARGDGKTDDSKAIQRAFDKIGTRPGDPKVVYFPPGHYLIKTSLVLTERNGAMLVGHGRETILEWGGEAGGRMLWSNGAGRTVYLGLVFDGRKVAGVGIDHDSKTIYETRVRHESLEFRNFRDAGIRVGSAQKLASAEMMFYNLVFRNNGAGARFLAWNDYNNVFDGCLFEDNDYGIFAGKGNVVVRNSRFERSRVADALLSTHSHSFRRVVSLDSNRFIETVSGPTAAANVKVQASRISAWKSPGGAIVSHLRGPVLVFDTVFENAPKADAPPIALANPPYMLQQALVSDIVSTAASAVDVGVNGELRVLPSSGKASARAPTLGTQFLRSTVWMPERLLDVKRDCGARGDGKSNDSSALQTCIDKAAKGGDGTYLYFPSGRYRTTGTLHVDDASFWMGGTGWDTQIVRSGFGKGPVLSVHNPKALLLEHLRVGGAPGSISIEQTGDEAGSVFYRGIYGYHDAETANQAIRFKDLPAGTLVQSDHIDGRLKIEGSSAAHFLFGFAASVSVDVGGTAAPGGFLGFLFRVSALSDFPLEVSDNQSVVMSDWYNEQTGHLFKATGKGFGTGRITLDFSRAASTKPVFAYLDAFRGRVSVIGGGFGFPDDRVAPSVSVSSPEETSVTLMANSSWNEGLQLAPPGVAGYLGSNVVTGIKLNPFKKAPESVENPGAAVAALDDLRELGAMDVRYNVCR